jgi:hypothetical protein
MLMRHTCILMCPPPTPLTTTATTSESIIEFTLQVNRHCFWIYFYMDRMQNTIISWCKLICSYRVFQIQPHVAGVSIFCRWLLLTVKEISSGRWLYKIMPYQKNLLNWWRFWIILMKDPLRIPADTLIILTGLPLFYSVIPGKCRDST